ncbi:MAG: hypothetical protein DIU54_006025 [Acidobacteriota bacterium]|nr:MAG: hypothetical protein DIU54_00525 [Acidobacteriota bacterium]
MNDTARVLLTAAVLSAAVVAMLAWRLVRLEIDEAERLIGELRLMQWAGVLLAAVGAVPIGLAVATAAPLAHLDIALGAIFVGIAGFVMQRDPREGLLVACTALLAHALLDIAHRPGWLAADLAPRWYTVGCAVHNVLLAALCFLIRRR